MGGRIRRTNTCKAAWHNVSHGALAVIVVLLHARHFPSPPPEQEQWQAGHKSPFVCEV